MYFVDPDLTVSLTVLKSRRRNYDGDVCLFLFYDEQKCVSRCHNSSVCPSVSSSHLKNKQLSLWWAVCLALFFSLITFSLVYVIYWNKHFIGPLIFPASVQHHHRNRSWAHQDDRGKPVTIPDDVTVTVSVIWKEQWPTGRVPEHWAGQVVATLKTSSVND